MKPTSLDILTVVTKAKHSIVAWFECEHEGRTKRFAAMFEDPVNPNEAREWMMKGSEATRRLLADRHAPYDPAIDGPLFAQHYPGEHPAIVAYPVIDVAE